MLQRAVVLAACSLLGGHVASAQDVRITPDLVRHSTTINGQPLVIERIQDNAHQLTGEFSKTSHPCPPFCISPIEAAPGVRMVGQIEVMASLESRVAEGRGLLLDSRVPQ